ncbi:MAG TPA: trehalose-phosphatase [Cellulomonas sp.]
MSDLHAGAPTPLGPDQAARALHALATDPARGPVLLALDFDGTLAPLQDDPQASRLLPAAAVALRDLARHPARIRLALVSGRAVADLDHLAEVPVGTLLVGSHGAERARVTAHGLDRDEVRLTADQADRLDRLGRELQGIARGRDGVWVETKPTAAVVHTRLADDPVADQAETEALAVGARLGSTVLHGKDVVEISVLDADKGVALTGLRAEVGAGAVVYAGDDVTDEHAFAALLPGDLAIKVGPGATLAGYRLADPVALTALLTALAADLSGAQGDGTEGRGPRAAG